MEKKIIAIGSLQTHLQTLSKLGKRPPVTYETAEDFLWHLSPSGPSVYLVSANLTGFSTSDLIRVIRTNDKLSTIIVIDDSLEKSKLRTEYQGIDALVSPGMTPNLLLTLVETALSKTQYLQEASSSGIRVIPEARSVCHGEKAVGLTCSEFKIASRLIELTDQTCSRDELRHDLGGEVTERTVDVHMSSLRKKMTKIGLVIETIRGEGYRLRS